MTRSIDRSAASLAFVLALAGCAREQRLVRHAEYWFVSDETPAPPEVAPASSRWSPWLHPRDQFEIVQGVLLSPDGRWLAVAGSEALGRGGCGAPLRTVVWLYDTESWHATVVTALGYEAAKWGFDEEGGALVVADSASPGLSADAIDLVTAKKVAAGVTPLEAPSMTSVAGGWRAKSDLQTVEITRAGSAKPLLRLGRRSAAVAAAASLESGATFFAARWPDGSFALWDVSKSLPIPMSPPPPKSVSAVAFVDDGLLLAGRDGSFWRYEAGRGGFFDGLELPRGSPLVARAFDVRGFVGREKVEDIGLVGGDPDAPLTGEVPVAVGCIGPSCGFSVGDTFLRVAASDQPGQISVWDGVASEPLGGDLATEFLCLDEGRTIDIANCREQTRVPWLFEQARTRANALRRSRQGL